MHVAVSWDPIFVYSMDVCCTCFCSACVAPLRLSVRYFLIICMRRKSLYHVCYSFDGPLASSCGVTRVGHSFSKVYAIYRVINPTRAESQKRRFYAPGANVLLFNKELLRIFGSRAFGISWLEVYSGKKRQRDAKFSHQPIILPRFFFHFLTIYFFWWTTFLKLRKK